MALILALESDHQQATLLGSLIRNKVQAELHIVDSRDAAIAAISARVPDVLLLSSLLSPRDEEDLLKHLRLVEGTEHVQTHNIPMMAATGRDEQTGSTGFFGRFRRKPKEPEVFAACDPAVYAEEIRSYVVRAEEAKIEAAARAHALVPLNAQPPAVVTPHAPVDAFTWKPRREEPEASAPAAPSPQKAGADRLDQLRHEAQDAERERLRQEMERERLREEETRARERERLRLDAEEARLRAEEEHRRREEDAAAAREAETALARARQEERVKGEEERRRLEMEAAERERVLRAAEAAAQREIEAARKEFEEEQQRLREEEAAERERLLREAALATERAALAERERLQAERERLQEEMRLRQTEEAAERAQLKREAEEAIERARVAERARHEQEQLRLQAEQTAERERLRREAEAAGERARQAEEAAARERLMREAEEAGERARQSERERLEQDRRRLEAEQTAQREQLVRETEAAAERARQAEEERERAEQRRIAAETAAARGREEAEQRLAAQQAAEGERALRRAESQRAQRQKEEAATIERRPKRHPERKGKTPRKQKPPPVQPESLPGLAASAGPVPATPARKGRPAPQVSDEPFADFRAVVSGSSIDSIFKLMPITSWARPERPRPVETTDEQEEALALLARLKLPVPVSGFVYATGCRIRRVRVPSIADDHAGSVSGPVIVSRRALEELRTPR